MQSNAARLAVLAAAVAAAVVLFIILNGGSDGGDDSADGGGGTTTASGPRVVGVKDGKPLGGVQTFTYDKGDQVSLEVRLDRPEESVHVHGYEIEEPAENSPVRLSFPARLDGAFEIEVHRADGSDAQIAELEVNP